MGKDFGVVGKKGGPPKTGEGEKKSQKLHEK